MKQGGRFRRYTRLSHEFSLPRAHTAIVRIWAPHEHSPGLTPGDIRMLRIHPHASALLLLYVWRPQSIPWRAQDEHTSSSCACGGKSHRIKRHPPCRSLAHRSRSYALRTYCPHCHLMSLPPSHSDSKAPLGKGASAGLDRRPTPPGAVKSPPSAIEPPSPTMKSTPSTVGSLSDTAKPPAHESILDDDDDTIDEKFKERTHDGKLIELEASPVSLIVTHRHKKKHV
ncbi:hypothetical protein BD310DRAFT_315575 [Dichomitus squalens]|uniref:Uncharacterized protein n=1 Tax=Dichomitus squalens TaxID=114155 RepID=A0A4Q9PAR6_9APHY|nr:hypothetical protein BD310DRAFT_315575 [Dichomitus squalens]